MWTAVIPHEVEVYVDDIATARFRPIVVASLDTPRNDGCVLWTGVRVTSEEALDRLMHALDALARNEDGSFFIVPGFSCDVESVYKRHLKRYGMRGVWCDLAALAACPPSVPVVGGEAVDFDLARGLHLGACTESALLSRRPLLRLCARMTLVATVAGHVALDPSTSGASALVDGLRQNDHPLSSMLPPYLSRVLQALPATDPRTCSRLTRGVRRRAKDAVDLLLAGSDGPWATRRITPVDVISTQESVP